MMHRVRKTRAEGGLELEVAITRPRLLAVLRSTTNKLSLGGVSWNDEGAVPASLLVARTAVIMWLMHIAAVALRHSRLQDKIPHEVSWQVCRA